MKKKKKNILKIAGLTTLMLPGMFFITACGGDKAPAHTHNYSELWSYNEINHFHECDGCDEKQGVEAHGHTIIAEYDETQHKLTCECGHVIYENHTGGTATCQNKAICEDCGEEYGDLAGHNHATAWINDNETHHWHACQTEGCTDKSGYAEHNHSLISVHNATQHKFTCECGHVIYENHSFNDWEIDLQDVNQLKRTCNDCGQPEYVGNQIETISTSTKNNDSSITMTDCAAGSNYTFRYVVNSAPISELSINILDSDGTSFDLGGNSDAYNLKIFVLNTDNTYVEISSDFQNDGERWEYLGTQSLADKTLLIFISLNEEQTKFYVEVNQKDYVIVTRDLNGGELDNNTPITVEYGKNYLSNPINLGTPTKLGFNFDGWCLTSPDANGLRIGHVTEYDKFYATWQHNNLYPLHDWYGDGQVTIYAKWVLAPRIVTLTLEGEGEWSNHTNTDKECTLIEGQTIDAEFIPTRNGYTFMGFFGGFGGNNKTIISAEGVVQNLSYITDPSVRKELSVKWFKTMTTPTETFASISRGGEIRAYKTGNWTLPTGQTTAEVRIELVNTDNTTYGIRVYDGTGNKVNAKANNKNIFNLKPNTFYQIIVEAKSNPALSNKTLVINRDLVANTSGSSSIYELKGISVLAGEKVVLRLNQTYGWTYTLKTTREPENNVVPKSSLTSIKIYDEDMNIIKSLDETILGNGEYNVGLLTANTNYYVEIIFNSSLSNVNFTL